MKKGACEKISVNTDLRDSPKFCVNLLGGVE